MGVEDIEKPSSLSELNSNEILSDQWIIVDAKQYSIIVQSVSIIADNIFLINSQLNVNETTDSGMNS